MLLNWEITNLYLCGQSVFKFWCFILTSYGLHKFCYATRFPQYPQAINDKSSGLSKWEWYPKRHGILRKKNHDFCLIKNHFIFTSYLISGKLAAAIAWPTRRLFSSGNCMFIPADSGKSDLRTWLAPSRINRPPLPEVQRPRIRTCFSL